MRSARKPLTSDARFAIGRAGALSGCDRDAADLVCASVQQGEDAWRVLHARHVTVITIPGTLLSMVSQPASATHANGALIGALIR